jgi:hypothetical protein
LIDQNQVKVPKTYTAASISRVAILLLLAGGVIGILSLSRKKKDIGSSGERTGNNKTPYYQNLNQKKPKPNYLFRKIELS